MRDRLQASVLAMAMALALVGGICVTAAAAASTVPAPAVSFTVAQAQGRGAPAGYLDGVSCPTATFCVATGATWTKGKSIATADAVHPLIEMRTNGAWKVSQLPLQPGFTSSFSLGITCAAPGSCLVVGYSFDSNSEHLFVSSLAKGRWSYMTVPKAAETAADSFLWGISCPTAGHCVAVGDTVKSQTSNPQPLVMTLADGRWSITPSPSAGAGGGNLTGVDCTTSSSCEAVGYESPAKSGNTATSLIEDLAIGMWSIAKGPAAPVTVEGFELSGVSCAEPGSCEAVGQLKGPVPVIDTLGGNGIWQAMSSPDPDAQLGGSGLYGVSCLTGSACLAAGAKSVTSAFDTADGTVGAPLAPLLEQLTSTGWEILAEPSGIPATSGLVSVSCASATCVAVGTTGKGATYNAPLYPLILQSP